MTKVYRITEAEADLLRGKEFDTDSYFNPIQDFDGNWIISIEEVMYLKKVEFNFLKSKIKIDYKDKYKDTDPFTGEKIEPKSLISRIFKFFKVW